MIFDDDSQGGNPKRKAQARRFLQREEVTFNKGLSTGARLIYIALDEYARDKGTCFPGQETLAERLGISLRTVRRKIAELRRAKVLISKRPSFGGTNTYTLCRRFEEPTPKKTLAETFVKENCPPLRPPREDASDLSLRPKIATPPPYSLNQDIETINQSVSPIAKVIREETGEQVTSHVLNPIVQVMKERDLPEEIIIRWLCDKCRELRQRYPDKPIAGILKNAVKTDISAWMDRNRHLVVESFRRRDLNRRRDA
jgi:DNA-binding transcriptional regulator YhcF (GntR family)